MKRLIFALLLLVSAAGVAYAQDKMIIVRDRPVADLVKTLGGEMGYSPSVNNAEIIKDAIESRLYGAINIPTGVCVITEPIVWRDLSGMTLQGAGRNTDAGETVFSGGGHGGACTRLVADFDTSDDPMIIYQGKEGTISDIAFEANAHRGAWWNFITNATNANPIVCTTSGVHGLSDNDQVTIYGITGNTNANGTFYVDMLTDTTFALYAESGPTTAVVGNGGDTTPNDVSAVWFPVNRAQIGIHVMSASGSGWSSGKIHIERCSFHEMPVGILFGLGMHQAWQAAADYDGETDANADESVVAHCTFHWPYTLNYPATDYRTAMYFRTIQSVVFQLPSNTINGNATEFLYFERGGACDAWLSVNGNVKNGVLRIGEALFPVDYNVWVNVDGGATDEVLGRYTKILNMDRHSAGGHVIIRGNQRAAHGDNLTAVLRPQFLVKGACKLNIRDFNGLVPDGITLDGNVDTQQFPALLTMENCTHYYHNDPKNAVAGTGDTNPSSAPAFYRWSDDQAAFATDGVTMQLQPIADGQDVTMIGSTVIAE